MLIKLAKLASGVGSIGPAGEKNIDFRIIYINEHPIQVLQVNMSQAAFLTACLAGLRLAMRVTRPSYELHVSSIFFAKSQCQFTWKNRAEFQKMSFDSLDGGRSNLWCGFAASARALWIAAVLDT